MNVQEFDGVFEETPRILRTNKLFEGWNGMHYYEIHKRIFFFYYFGWFLCWNKAL